MFRAEESVGLAMMQGLGPEQQAKAIIGTRLPGEVLTAAYRITSACPTKASATTISHPGSKRATRSDGVYLHNIRPGHAEIRLEEALDHLRDTHFSWIGAHDDHGALLLPHLQSGRAIEFDHQPGIVYANDEPTRDHIHTVVRTPNGNDYGKDLLRQHYARHDHSHPGSPHRRGRE